MAYKTYEDRVREAADVLRTLTPEQSEAVTVFGGLVDRIGELRQTLNGYPKHGTLSHEQQKVSDEYFDRGTLYIQMLNALRGSGK
jgi:hypothetical protein